MAGLGHEAAFAESSRNPEVTTHLHGTAPAPNLEPFRSVLDRFFSLRLRARTACMRLWVHDDPVLEHACACACVLWPNILVLVLLLKSGVHANEDINEMLQSGADKISINTAAHRDIKIISDASEAFGAQSVVASVQAKRRARMQWDSLYLNGRENSSTSVVDWCKTLVGGGVGEILLTSIDQDGTMMGPDKELIDTVLANVRIPVVVSGGVSSAEDVLWIAEAGASGVAIARCLHFKHFEIKDVKKYLKKNNVAVSWRY